MIESRLRDGVTLRQIDDALYSTLSEGDEGATYDRYAAAYDRMVASPIYMRLAWGVSRRHNTGFIERAFDLSVDGPVLDVAAGSCVDSAAAYVAGDQETIVLDRSLDMLRRGIERVAEVAGRVPDHVRFLQADAFDLPFRDGTIGTVLCHGAYHLFEDTAGLTAEWHRVLPPRGSVFVSSLARGRWFGDRYLGFLHRSGEIAVPRSAPEIAERLEADLACAVELEVEGNFVYAVATVDQGGTAMFPTAG